MLLHMSEASVLNSNNYHFNNYHYHNETFEIQIVRQQMDKRTALWRRGSDSMVWSKVCPTERLVHTI